MCQYSCVDGFATDWHLVHLGSRAVGGAALVITEATSVDPRGRISPGDLGLWKDEQISALAPIAQFIRAQGAVAGIQLAHAGRKASVRAPWDQRGAFLQPDVGGWQTVAPSAVPFQETDGTPHSLTTREIKELVESFAASARRAWTAGFQVVEIHGAHGYLIHEFLSPLSNRREDLYGGSLENRMRFALEVATAVRQVWPEALPLFFRISATEWVEGGWTVGESVELARCLQPLGVDLIDCSSGGLVPYAKIQPAPGYQVPFAEEVRREAQIATGAVGMITDAQQADGIVRGGKADLVLIAREMLRDPYWPLHAEKVLGQSVHAPVQYDRAF